MKAWTDYPSEFLGDTEGREASIREIDALSYDGDKLCLISVCGVETEIKSGYVYERPGRAGEVSSVSREWLAKITSGEKVSVVRDHR